MATNPQAPAANTYRPTANPARRIRQRTFACLTVLASSLAACAPADEEVAPQDIQLTFEARVGDELFDCSETYTGLGTSEATARPSDFRLYVHNLRMIDNHGEEVPVQLEDDGLWQDQGMALLDFEDNSGSCKNGTSEVNMLVSGTVPSGTYSGVAFDVGVPMEFNHDNPATAPSPLNLTALHWNWAAGYKHARIDFMVDNTNSAGETNSQPFNFHLGSTRCTGDPELNEAVVCENSNRPSILLETFDPGQQKIVIDYAKLVATEDMNDELGAAPGCMSGPADGDCPHIFSQLGLAMKSGTSDASQQVFFGEDQ